MMARGYSLHLYCDKVCPTVYETRLMDVPRGSHNGGEFPHKFEGETFAECRRNARHRGWTFHRDGLLSCPRCSK